MVKIILTKVSAENCTLSINFQTCIVSFIAGEYLGAEREAQSQLCKKISEAFLALNPFDCPTVML